MFWNHRVCERRLVADRRCVEVHVCLLGLLVQRVLQRLLLAGGLRHQRQRRGERGAAERLRLGAQGADQPNSLLDLDGALEPD